MDSKHVSWFPKRKHVHDELGKFLKLIDDVIENKRAFLENTTLSDIPEAERDILTLMLEAESAEDGRLTDEELRVSKRRSVIDHLLMRNARATFVSFSLQDMTQRQMHYLMLATTWPKIQTYSKELEKRCFEFLEIHQKTYCQRLNKSRR